MGSRVCGTAGHEARDCDMIIFATCPVFAGLELICGTSAGLWGPNSALGQNFPLSRLNGHVCKVQILPTARTWKIPWQKNPNGARTELCKKLTLHPMSLETALSQRGTQRLKILQFLAGFPLPFLHSHCMTISTSDLLFFPGCSRNSLF